LRCEFIFGFQIVSECARVAYARTSNRAS
jgi:hypothetical protein